MVPYIRSGGQGTTGAEAPTLLTLGPTLPRVLHVYSLIQASWQRWGRHCSCPFTNEKALAQGASSMPRITELGSRGAGREAWSCGDSPHFHLLCHMLPHGAGDQVTLELKPKSEEGAGHIRIWGGVSQMRG